MKIYDVRGIGANLTGSFSGSFNGLFAGTVEGVSATASYVEYNNVANKPALVSGSSQITYSGLTGIPSGIVSSSAQVAGYNIFATTGSNQFNGSQVITGSLTTTGTIVAQTLNVQQVTSSIVYSSGSNIFGNSISNVQQFTGSISASGSMSITPGITVTGDGSNDMFKAVRAGNTRFVVKNAVNSVGINTDTINNPLTVNGGADFSGNVGIGNTSPQGLLQIGANALSNNSDASNAFNLKQTSTTAATGIYLERSGERKGYYMYMGGSLDSLTFQRNNAGTKADVMSLTRDGNVGIENDSPVTKLTLGSYSGARLPYINGTGATFSANGITVASANSGNAAIGGGLDLTNNTYSVNAYSPIISFSSLSLSAAYNNAYAGIWGQLGGPGGDSNWNVGALVFGTAGSYGINERMRINSVGNVGIGTTSADEKLTIQSGNIKLYSFQNAANEYRYIGTEYSSGNGNNRAEIRFAIDDSDTNTRLTFHTAAGGGTLNERMRITSGGQVLIGKTALNMSSSGIELYPNGTSLHAFNITNNEAVIFNNIATGTTYEIDFRTNTVERGKISVTDSGVSYVTTSDYRAKEDLKSTTGLDKIDAIKIYDFKFKDTGTRMDGVLAHELQEIIPYAVTGEKDGEKLQGVDYSKLIPILVKSIQELKAELDTAKAEIQLLKQQ